MKIVKRLFAPKPKGLPIITERELIQREAKIGGRLFGITPPDRRREFFALDARTWIWYEEWNDANGIHRVTTRYEVHSNNVLKIQDGQQAELVTGEELVNLAQATKAYYYQVADKVYNRPVVQA